MSSSRRARRRRRQERRKRLERRFHRTRFGGTLPAGAFPWMPMDRAFVADREEVERVSREFDRRFWEKVFNDPAEFAALYAEGAGIPAPSEVQMTLIRQIMAERRNRELGIVVPQSKPIRFRPEDS